MSFNATKHSLFEQLCTENTELAPSQETTENQNHRLTPATQAFDAFNTAFTGLFAKEAAAHGHQTSSQTSTILLLLWRRGLVLHLRWIWLGRWVLPLRGRVISLLWLLRIGHFGLDRIIKKTPVEPDRLQQRLQEYMNERNPSRDQAEGINPQRIAGAAARWGRPRLACLGPVVQSWGPTPIDQSREAERPYGSGKLWKSRDHSICWPCRSQHANSTPVSISPYLCRTSLPGETSLEERDRLPRTPRGNERRCLAL